MDDATLPKGELNVHFVSDVTLNSLNFSRFPDLF